MGTTATHRSIKDEPKHCELDALIRTWNYRKALASEARPPEQHQSGHVVRKHVLNDED